MQHPRSLLPILGLLLGATSAAALGQITPIDHDPQTDLVLFIGAINPDCFPDTVLGSVTPDHAGYLPHAIRWGMPNPATQGRPVPGCPDRSPGDSRPRQTTITYPDHWDIRGGAVAFQHLNDDSLIDIVLHLRGTLANDRTDDASDDPREQRRAIALFGQQGLDTIPLIALEELRRFQTHPFVAMELVVGSELTHPAVRDLSGQTSYLLEPIALRINEPEASRLLAASSVAGLEQHAIAIQVVPNPSSTALRVEATGITGGAYRLELVSLSGAVEQRTTITLAPGERLGHTLEVAQVPSGSYVVRIGSEQGTLASTAPIIITH